MAKIPTYEVYSNGGDEGLCEGVVRKAKEERRLSDSRISNEEELEEVITGMKMKLEIRESATYSTSIKARK